MNVRRSRIHIVPVLVALALGLSLGCATTAPSTTPTVSAVDKAEGYYGALSEAYKGGQAAIVELRASHHVTDAQWAIFDAAQHQVARYSPRVSKYLREWKASCLQPSGCVQPDGYQAVLSLLTDALSDVFAVKAAATKTPAEVKK